MSSLYHYLRRVFLAQHCSGLTDGELLEAFVARGDGACFEALVRRHGPMVLGVCRRLLRDCHDAEDAFQAVFLVLVRRAAAVPPEAVGNWLYGVAYRTALNVRRAAARRRARERSEDHMPHPMTKPAEDWTELRPLLDDALTRLPDKYRSAFVLCDLEGLTRAEAARHLGVPEGTVSGRLTTARRMLAERLTRRGLTLSAGALTTVLAQGSAIAAVPASLVAATVRAVETAAAGATAGLVSAEVASLVDGVAKGLTAASWKPLALVLLAVPMFTVGAAVLAPRGRESLTAVARPDSPRPAVPTRGPQRPEPTAREKLQGEWRVVSVETNGKSILDAGFIGTRFLFAGDRFTYRMANGVQEGTYQLDPTGTPMTLQLSFGKDAFMDCVCEVTATRLKVCGRKLGPRPVLWVFGATAVGFGPSPLGQGPCLAASALIPGSTPRPEGFDSVKEHDAVLFVFEKQ
jgi:RNA polymerase sigma factor (sigma-70 family)